MNKETLKKIATDTAKLVEESQRVQAELSAANTKIAALTTKENEFEKKVAEWADKLAERGSLKPETKKAFVEGIKKNPSSIIAVAESLIDNTLPKLGSADGGSVSSVEQSTDPVLKFAMS